MVGHVGSLDSLVYAAQVKSPLPEPTRTIAFMAILGIALLGMLLIVVTMLGASWVRKQGRFQRGPAVPPDVFLEPQKKTMASRQAGQGEVTGDTVSSDGCDDTQIS